MIRAAEHRPADLHFQALEAAEGTEVVEAQQLSEAVCEQASGNGM